MKRRLRNHVSCLSWNYQHAAWILFFSDSVFFLKFFRITFICAMAIRNGLNSEGTRFVISQYFLGKSCHSSCNRATLEESLINCWDQIILYSLYYFFDTLITIDKNFQFNECCLNSFVSAIVEVNKNESNDVHTKEDLLNAIHFYTEEIKEKCENKELKAKLYNDRATVYFKLGKNLAILRIFTFFSFHLENGLTEFLRWSRTHVCV